MSDCELKFSKKKKMTEEKELNPNEEAEAKSQEEGNVYVTQDDFKNLQKGVENLASKLNQSGENVEQEENAEEASTTPAPTISPIVKKLYLEKTPEIEEVWDEVEAEAKSLGQDTIEYYESKTGWKLEAKARANAKEKKEQTKNDIDSPSGTITSDTKINFDKITPEQIRNLDSGARDNYREHLRRAEGGVSIRRIKD